MSALHGSARARKARVAPPRRSLNLVPRSRPKAARAPFVTVVACAIVGGLVGLLVLNTAMQKRAFELADLQESATSLTTKESALRVEVEKLSSPTHVANKAGDLGMVPNTNPVFLRLSDGRVIGKPEPALPGTNLPGIEPPGPTPQEIAVKKQKEAAQEKVERNTAAQKQRQQKQPNGPKKKASR